MESEILLAIENRLQNIKEDANNSNSASMFKKVIANNTPIWTAVELTPSVCFYLSETKYTDVDGLRYNGTSTIQLYVYNKHKARGLSLKDILTKYIDAIRAEVQGLPSVSPNILNAFVSNVSRDGGTVLPYTIAEITVSIEFTELKVCNN